MAAAISAACVSGAKCLASKKRTVAFGMSRLNASAPPAGRMGRFCPMRPVGILPEGRIARDAALVVAEQVELHLGHAAPGEVEIVERVAVRRDPVVVGYAVVVFSSGRLASQADHEEIRPTADDPHRQASGLLRGNERVLAPRIATRSMGP